MKKKKRKYKKTKSEKTNVKETKLKDEITTVYSEKKDSMVDKAIEAEARFVSLFNCEDRIYKAGEVGSVK